MGWSKDVAIPGKSDLHFFNLDDKFSIFSFDEFGWSSFHITNKLILYHSPTD